MRMDQGMMVGRKTRVNLDTILDRKLLGWPNKAGWDPDSDSSDLNPEMTRENAL